MKKKVKKKKKLTYWKFKVKKKMFRKVFFNLFSKLKLQDDKMINWRNIELL